MNDDVVDIHLRLDLENNSLDEVKREIDKVMKEYEKAHSIQVDTANETRSKKARADALQNAEALQKAYIHIKNTMEMMQKLQDSMNRENMESPVTKATRAYKLMVGQMKEVQRYQRELYAEQSRQGREQRAADQLNGDNKQTLQLKKQIADEQQKINDAVQRQKQAEQTIKDSQKEVARLSKEIATENEKRLASDNSSKSAIQKQLEARRQLERAAVSEAKVVRSEAQDEIKAAQQTINAQRQKLQAIQEERAERARAHQAEADAAAKNKQYAQEDLAASQRKADALAKEYDFYNRVANARSEEAADEELLLQYAQKKTNIEDGYRQKIEEERNDLIQSVKAADELAGIKRSNLTAEEALAQKVQQETRAENERLGILRGIKRGFQDIYNERIKEGDKTYSQLSAEEKLKVLIEEEARLRKQNLQIQQQMAKLNQDLIAEKNNKYIDEEEIANLEAVKEQLATEMAITREKQNEIKAERQLTEETIKAANAAKGLSDSGKGLGNNTYYALRAVKMLNFEVTKMRTSFSTLMKGMQSFGSGLLRVFTAMLLPLSLMPGHFTKATKESGKLNKSLKIGLGTILRYSIGIRSFYMLISKMRSWMLWGMENLATQVSAVDKQVSSLWNNFRQLKNQMAATAQPILNILVPAFDKLAAYVEKALNMIGQFFAALTGQSFVYKAAEVTGSWADSLAKSAKEAKKLKKELSGLDKLNVLHSQDDNDSGSGKAGNGGFTTVPIDPKIKDFVDKLKDILGKLFDPLKKAWQKKGKKVLDAAKQALDAIWGLVKAIGRDFLTMWGDAETEKMFEDLLDILANIFYIIRNIANGWHEAWDANDNGLRALRAMRDILAIIIADIKRFTDFLVEWTEKLNWIPLFTAIADVLEKQVVPAVRNISGLITDILIDLVDIIGTWLIEKALPKIVLMIGNMVEAAGNLAGKFREAWNENKTGRKILKDIVALFDIILDHLLELTKHTAEWAETVDFTPLLQQIDSFLKAMQDPLNFLMDTFVYLYENVVLPFISYLVEEGLPKLLQVLEDISNAIDWDLLKERVDSFMDSFEPFLEKGWETFLIIIEDIGKALANFVNSDGFGNFVDTLKRWMDEADPREMATAIENFAKALILLKASLTIGHLLLTAAEGFLTISNAVQQLSKLNFAGIFGKIGTHIGNITQGAKDCGEAFKLLAHNKDLLGFQGTIAGIAGVVAGMVINLKGFGDSMSEGFSVGNEAAMILGVTVAGLGAVFLGLPGGIAVAIGAAILAIENFFIAINNYPEEFGEKINSLGDFIGHLWENIDEWFKGIKDKIKNFGKDFGKSIGEWVGKAIDAFSDFPENFKKWAETVDWLELGINIVKGILQIFFLPAKLIALVLEAIAAFFEGFVEGLREGFDMHSPSKKMEPYGEDILKGILNGIIAAIKGIPEWIKQNVFKPIKDGFDKAIQGGKDFVKNGGEVVKGLKDGVVNKYKETKSKFSETWENIKSGAKKKLEGNKLLSSGKNFFNGLHSGIKEAWTSKKQSIEAIWTKITDTAKKKVSKDTLTKNGSQFINGMWSGIKTSWNTVFPNIKGLWDKIKTTATNKLNANTLLSTGKHLISGLWRGIKEKWHDLIQDFKDKINDLKESAKEALDINSPSKVFEKIGVQTMEGLEKGIDKEASKASDDITDVMDEMIPDKSNTQSFYETFLANMQDMRVEAVQEVELMIEEINNALMNLEASTSVQALVDSISNISSMRLPDITLGNVNPSSTTVIQIDQNDEIYKKLPTMLKDAFVEALEESTLNTESNGDIIVEVEGSTLFTAVKKQNDVYVKRYGKSAFA